ncbi:MAG TPA: diguanylate cyclase [Planctomycetota bacterium]|jgi:diguanylate cyclase (GGDEF)-like protein/PAS domain S-box-containing protein
MEVVTASVTLALLLLSILLAWSMRRIDAVRRANAVLQQVNHQLESRVSELSHQSNLMEALMDNIPDQIYFKDVESRFLKVNRGVAGTLGLNSPSEALGKTDCDFYSADDASSFRLDDQSVMTNQKPLRDRIELGHTGRGEQWMSTTKAPVFDATGKVIGLVGISRDITERKRADEVLRESEERYRIVVESLTEGIVVSDLSGQTLEWNRAALAMHGYATLDEARHRLSDFAATFELTTLGESVLPLDQWPLARILRGEDLRDCQLRIRRVGSSWQRVFSYGGTLVRDDHGQPRLAVITLSDITERKQLEDELRHSATHDKLTGLFNRHQFDERLIEAWRVSKRYSMPLCLCMCDLDNFKVINDTFGHQAGDRVLAGFADCIRQVIRESDFAGRFGGDEFCILFPNTTAEQAQHAVERIRAFLERQTILSAEGTSIRVTSSFGLAMRQPETTETHLFAQADKALYTAKKNGRNCVIVI